MAIKKKKERKWLGEVIEESLWGKDHKSTLLYIETRCVDYAGKLDHRHMRTNGNVYPTYLLDGVVLVGHSDWDCLRDLEAAGLLKNHGTGTNPLLELTEKGWEKAHELRKQRAKRIFEK